MIGLVTAANKCLTPINEIIPFVASLRLCGTVYLTTRSPYPYFISLTSVVSNVTTAILGSYIACQSTNNEYNGLGHTAVPVNLNPIFYINHSITSCSDIRYFFNISMW